MTEISTVRINKKNRNISLDILKLIASYMVVFIHFVFSGKIGYIIDALARFAVPVFFMTSGYFSYKNNTNKLKTKIINIVRIYLSGFILYFCFNGILTLYDAGIKGTIRYCLSYVNIIRIIELIIFNITRSSVHLWFLVALIYVYGIQYFVTKWKINEHIYMWVAVSLLIIHLILGVGLSAIGIVVPIQWVRNFLFMGYPFFCIGIFLRKNEDIMVKTITYKIAIAMILIGVIETGISFLVCGKNELYIGSVLIANALFIIALKMKDKRFNTKLTELSQTSTIIYLIHIMIGNSLERIVPTNAPLWRFASPVFICIVSTLVALLFIRIKNKVIKDQHEKNNFLS